MVNAIFSPEKFYEIFSWASSRFGCNKKLEGIFILFIIKTLSSIQQESLLWHKIILLRHMHLYSNEVYAYKYSSLDGLKETSRNNLTLCWNWWDYFKILNFTINLLIVYYKKFIWFDERSLKFFLHTQTLIRSDFVVTEFHYNFFFFETLVIEYGVILGIWKHTF